jgi:hypothetical protein
MKGAAGYCNIEMNSTPAYSYNQEYGGQSIAEPLVEHLVGGSNCERTPMMSVQVIENWALIRGKVVQIQHHPQLAGYTVVTIEVAEVLSVEGYPNLFEWASGQRIAVNVLASRTNELALGTGDQIVLRIRKSGPDSAFADPGSIEKRN